MRLSAHTHRCSQGKTPGPAQAVFPPGPWHTRVMSDSRRWYAPRSTPAPAVAVLPRLLRSLMRASAPLIVTVLPVWHRTAASGAGSEVAR